MTFSVIIPIYNTNIPKLRRCFDSILSQTYHDFELIIVDDGSENNLATFLDKYANEDKRIKVFHKENGGVSSARNKGLENSTGEWIIFVDSDDYVLPEHLKMFSDAITENVDMIITGFKQIDETGEISHQYSNDYYLGVQEISTFINNTDFLSHQTPWDKCFRRKEIKFDECLSLSEDRLFCYQYLLYCKGIATLQSVTYIHDRLVDMGLSSRYYPSSMNMHRYKIFRCITKKLRKKYNIDYKKIESYQEYLYSELRASLIRENRKITKLIMFLMHKFLFFRNIIPQK